MRRTRVWLVFVLVVGCVVAASAAAVTWREGHGAFARPRRHDDDAKPPADDPDDGMPDDGGDDDGDGGGKSGYVPQPPVDIGFLSVGLSAAMVAINVLVSNRLSLGAGPRIAVSAGRCVGQLLLLAVVLRPILELDTWLLVLPYLAIMLLLASYEVTAKITHGYAGVWLHVLLCLGASATSMLLYGMLVILRLGSAWFNPQYSIPLFGMLLGNSLTALTLGLNHSLGKLHDKRHEVEAMLALGASRWEAARELVQGALTQAQTPMLNMLATAGLVNIPGMMTGQVIAGQDVMQAARYQIMALFLIAATVCASSAAVVLLAVFTVVDGAHRLNSAMMAQNGGGAPKKTLSAAIDQGLRALGDRLAYGVANIQDRYHVLQRRFGRRGAGYRPPRRQGSVAAPEDEHAHMLPGAPGASDTHDSSDGVTYAPPIAAERVTGRGVAAGVGDLALGGPIHRHTGSGAGAGASATERDG
ncbi:unnamed protein product [Pedinophyceae sp. YPF-701]|nr:unnamed protein product [Pedinophyceae sp. YPF-701]